MPQDEMDKVGESISKNSLNLLILYGSVAVFGISFWLLAARFYQIDSVGNAAVIISLAGLASAMSTLGTNWWIIRYVSGEENKSRFLNEAFSLVSIASVLMSIPVLLFVVVSEISKTNSFDLGLLLSATGLLILSGSIHQIFSNTMVGLGKSRLALYQAILTNGLRLPLVLCFQSLGTAGIVLAVAATTLFGTMAGYLYVRTIIPNLHLGLSLKLHRIRMGTHFLAGNYITSMIEMSPGSLLPLMISSTLGASYAAQFYVCWLLASIPMSVAAAVNTSFVARCSVPGAQLSVGLSKASRLLASLVTPAVIALIVLGPEILHFFGGGYSGASNSLPFFILFGALFSVTSLEESIFRLKTKMRPLVAVAAIWSLGSIGLAWIMLSMNNLTGVGLSLLVAQISAASLGFLLLHSKINESILT